MSGDVGWASQGFACHDALPFFKSRPGIVAGAVFLFYKNKKDLKSKNCQSDDNGADVSVRRKNVFSIRRPARLRKCKCAVKARGSPYPMDMGLSRVRRKIKNKSSKRAVFKAV